MLKELSVGEVARRSGVAVSTVHFYEFARSDREPPYRRQPAPLQP